MTYDYMFIGTPDQWAERLAFCKEHFGPASHYTDVPVTSDRMGFVQISCMMHFMRNEDFVCFIHTFPMKYEMNICDLSGIWDKRARPHRDGVQRVFDQSMRHPLGNMGVWEPTVLGGEDERTMAACRNLTHLMDCEERWIREVLIERRADPGDARMVVTRDYHMIDVDGGPLGVEIHMFLEIGDERVYPMTGKEAA